MGGPEQHLVASLLIVVFVHAQLPVNLPEGLLIPRLMRVPIDLLAVAVGPVIDQLLAALVLIPLILVIVEFAHVPPESATSYSGRL